MKKIVLGCCILFASHYIIPMDSELFVLSDKDGQKITIPLNVARCAPLVVNRQHEIRNLCFPDAEKEDLDHIATYLATYSSIEKVLDIKCVMPLKNSFYDYAKKLTVQNLIQLTENIGVLFPDKKLYADSYLDSLYNEAHWRGADEGSLQLLIAVKQKVNEKLVKSLHQKNGCKTLSQSVELSSWFTVLSSFFPQPTVKYIYAGNSMLASLSGRVHQSSPFYNYLLRIQTKKGERVFALGEGADVDYKVEGAFVNNDESLFVCMYHNVMDDGNKGLFIVNTVNAEDRFFVSTVEDNVSKKIPYPHKACCFGLDNEIYGFDGNGQIWVLNLDTECCLLLTQATYCGIKSGSEKFKNIQGIINYKHTNSFIVYTDHNLFHLERDSGNQFILEEFPVNFDVAPSNVIVDPSKKKVCIMIETWSRTCDNGLSCSDLVSDVYLYDLMGSDDPQLVKELNGKVFASFSLDGTLLIMSHYDNDSHKIIYDMYDIITDKSCCKESSAQILALGANYSIEERDYLFTSATHYVMLSDQGQQQIGSINDHFEQSSPAIGELVHRLIKEFPMVGPTNVEANRKAVEQNTTITAQENIVASKSSNGWFSLKGIGQTLSDYRRYIIGAVVILGIVGMLKARK